MASILVAKYALTHTEQLGMCGWKDEEGFVLKIADASAQTQPTKDHSGAYIMEQSNKES